MANIYAHGRFKLGFELRKKKVINVTFETEDYHGLKAVFQRIVNQLRDGKEMDEGMVNGINYTFIQRFDSNANYEVKEIDGIQCKVFKSAFD